MASKAFYKKIKPVYELLKIAFLLLLVTVITLFFIKYVWQAISIEGDSMLPTFKDGDRILVLKVGNKAEYDRFDVIVFKPFDKDNVNTEEKEDDLLYIKRIVGLPGETVRIREDGVVTIMDSDGEFNPISGDGFAGVPNSRGINWNHFDDDYFETVTLGPDEYFVLGDNRSISLDSRSEQIRTINVNSIIGKYVLGINPFGKK